MFRIACIGQEEFLFSSFMSFVEEVEDPTTNDSNEIEEVKLLHLPSSVNASPWIPPRRNKRSNVISISRWQAFGRASATFKNKDIPIVLKRQVYDFTISASYQQSPTGLRPRILRNSKPWNSNYAESSLNYHEIVKQLNGLEKKPKYEISRKL